MKPGPVLTCLAARPFMAAGIPVKTKLITPSAAQGPWGLPGTDFQTFNEVKPFFKQDLTWPSPGEQVLLHILLPFGFRCDWPNHLRCAWRLWWARRRKDRISPSGSAALASPHPLRDVYALRWKAAFSSRPPCDGADSLGLPGTAPSACPVLGYLSEAPGNSVCQSSVLPQMLETPTAGEAVTAG